MYGTLKDIDSRGWRTWLIGAFIAQQVIFALICIVFRGDAVRPTLMYRPNGMTEADRELYYAYYDIGAAVGLNMNFIVYCAMVLPMLILVVYLFNYLHSLRKLQKSERRAALVMIAVCCVSYVAVVVYFRNYTGAFKMYMNFIPMEICALLSSSLYIIHNKCRRKEPELDAPITEAGE